MARCGGEEFIILFQNTGKEEALGCAEKIRELIASHNFPEKEKQPLGCISISGGIATYPTHGKTLNDLIQNADKALYESKNSGKNRVTQFRSLGLSQKVKSD